MNIPGFDDEFSKSQTVEIIIQYLLKFIYN